MISKILIATDGSEIALKAANQAIELAKQLKATVFILSVIDKRTLTMIETAQYSEATEAKTLFSSTGSEIKSIEEHLRKTAEENVEEVKKLCKENGVRSEFVITTGHPVEDIISEAERLKIDLIVMGSHGHSALAAAILGSVTYGVIHHDIKIPIMVTKG